jgi:DNA repair exonuclease SbcCD ATPase subunit
MNNEELTQLLEKLHAELDGMEHVDEKSRQLLNDLEKDINELLDRSDHDTLLERLDDAVDEFEVKYPSLTTMLSEISRILSNAGI